LTRVGAAAAVAVAEKSANLIFTGAEPPVKAVPANTHIPLATVAVAIPALLQAITPLVRVVAIVGAVAMPACIIPPAVGVPETIATANFNIERFLPEPLGFHSANCVDAAAAAPQICPAVGVVADVEVIDIENTLPLDVAS
jgi:hypothetical protein